MENKLKALKFLEESFNKSPRYKNNPTLGKEKVEHSLRVSHYASIIAKKEGLDEETLVLGGILHDISYGNLFEEMSPDWYDHGRNATLMSKAFIEGLPLTEKQKEDILYAIAIHVDFKSNVKGETNILTLSLTDADILDQFSPFRLYDALHKNDFFKMTLNEQNDFCHKQIKRLKERATHKFVTKIAKALCEKMLSFHLSFYESKLQEIKFFNLYRKEGNL